MPKDRPFVSLDVSQEAWDRIWGKQPAKYKGRKVLSKEELSKMDCPYPNEPKWDENWVEMNARTIKVKE